MSAETHSSAGAAPAPTTPPRGSARKARPPHPGTNRGRAGGAEASSADDGAAHRSGIERTTDLSDQVLEQVKLGQQAALEAVRGFMESVDRPVASGEEAPSRPYQVIDSALNMSQQLIRSEYDVLREIVRATGRALGDRRS